MDPQTESGLIDQCQKGEMQHFAELYDHYAQKIYAFIYYKVLDRPQAEDLTSEVFLKMMKKIFSFDAQKSSFQTWTYTIARNTVIDYFRTLKTETDIEDVWDLEAADKTEEQANTVLNNDYLQTELKKLTPEQREILTLRFWQEMTYAEIADLLGKTEGSVKMAASRGMKKLKTEVLVLFFFSQPKI